MICLVLLLQAHMKHDDHHTHCTAMQRDFLVLHARLACLVCVKHRLIPGKD